VTSALRGSQGHIPEFHKAQGPQSLRIKLLTAGFEEGKAGFQAKET